MELRRRPPRLLAVAALLIAGCGGDAAKAPAAPTTKPAVPVRVVAAERRDVAIEYRDVGTLEAEFLVHVAAETEGRIVEMAFQEGHSVEAGQLLVRLDGAKLEKELAAMQARVEKLRVQLENTRSTLARKRPLVDRRLVSEEEVTELEHRVRMEQAEIREVEASVERARISLTDTRILAPMDGLLGDREVSVGDYLKKGDEIVELVDLDPVLVRFRLPERYRKVAELGVTVAVEVAAYPGEEFTGTVTFVSPTVDPATRTLLLKADLPNPESRLRPGMFVHVRLVTGTLRDVAVVPELALLAEGKQSYLFAIDGGKARRVDVEPLHYFDREVAVRAELAAGTQVVYEGQYDLADGAEVDVVDSAGVGQVE